MDDLPTIIESTTLDAEQIDARTRQIHNALLNESPYFGEANFSRIHPDDLRRAFDHYDRVFFAGQVKPALGGTPLHFGLSKRMTSAGGKTARYTHRSDANRKWYEISVSTALLFDCFAGDDHRPISASGIVCRNRLEALQRVIEHEIVHLVEMLLWDRSSCAKPRFQSIAHRFFGHTGHRHELITPKERALAKFGIKAGDRVRFRFDDAEYTGVVNRITKRATVLVEDAAGERYSDGKHYAKFYIPVEYLEPAE